MHILNINNTYPTLTNLKLKHACLLNFGRSFSGHYAIRVKAVDRIDCQCTSFLTAPLKSLTKGQTFSNQVTWNISSTSNVDITAKDFSAQSHVIYTAGI